MTEWEAYKKLMALGQAYRDDWSDFDGREAKAEIQGLAEEFRSEAEAKLAAAEKRCEQGKCPNSGPFFKVYCTPLATKNDRIASLEAEVKRLKRPRFVTSAATEQDVKEDHARRQ